MGSSAFLNIGEREKFVEQCRTYIGLSASQYQLKNKVTDNSQKSGFYCSEFVKHALDDFGFDTNGLNFCEDFYNGFGIFSQVPHVGDLVFFSKTGYRVSHIAVMSGNKTMIHSPGINGGKIEEVVIADYLSKKQNDYENFIGKQKYSDCIIYSLMAGYKKPLFSGEEFTWLIDRNKY